MIDELNRDVQAALAGIIARTFRKMPKLPDGEPDYDQMAIEAMALVGLAYKRMQEELTKSPTN
jgi:hypothetical protein